MTLRCNIGALLYATIIVGFLSDLAICLDMSFTMEVAPRVRDCLHQYMAEGTHYEVEFQVGIYTGGFPLVAAISYKRLQFNVQL